MGTPLKLSHHQVQVPELYMRIYGSPSQSSGIKNILRGILPPLKRIIHNDMRILTDCIQTQERTLDTILQQLELRSNSYPLHTRARQAEVQKQELPHKAHPASIRYYRSELKAVYDALDRLEQQIKQLQQCIEELQNV